MSSQIRPGPPTLGGGGSSQVIPPGGSSTASVVNTNLSILKKILKAEAFTLGALEVSLHSGPPGLAGANEITAATRKSATAWAAAIAGLAENATEILWSSGIPLITVTHVVLWGGDVMVSSNALDTPKTIISGAARFAAGALKFGVSSTFTTYLANKILDYMLRSTAFTTAPVWGSIHTGTLDESGGGEVTGGSYARQQLSIANWSTDGFVLEGGSILSLPYNASATWHSVPNGATARIGFWDAVSGGNFLMWGSDLVLPSTDVTVASGELAAQLLQNP
jgi:hypothetical protein